MLPTHLRWTDPRPPYRLDPQDPVTLVVLDPRFHVSTDEENCVEFSYHCFNHARAYIHGECAPGPHLIALSCAEHGYENLSADMRMLWMPDGFDPPLDADQLRELAGD